MGNKERQTGEDDATCLANIAAAMDYEGIQIKNFNNQKKRVEDFDKLIKNKAGKKDNFQNTTAYMKEAIGSDNSCNGTTNQADIQTAVSTHATLSNCSTSVESVCVVPSGTFNSTELDSCETSFKAVAAKNKECYQQTTAASADLSAACTCWKAAAELVTTTKALKCSAKDSYDSINALKKTCKTKFSDCKKAEDASVGLIQVCNGGTTPSTASPSPSSVATTAAPSPAPSPTTAAPSPAAATTAAPAAPTTAAPAAPTTTAAQADTTTAAAGSQLRYNVKVALTHRAHESYGYATLLNSTTVALTELFYDGAGPKTNWIVGTGSPIGVDSNTYIIDKLSPTGEPLYSASDLSSAVPSLSAYSNQAETLTLPVVNGKQMTFHDISWIALYCRQVHMLFMDVLLPSAFQ